ncbi:MAG TPA: lipopolysaccharide kinase InaA family protein [Myxococcota bacterium]|nr:lipopolysaccharide kinase InaA family protein [Myxococcota bacterium]
MTVLRFRSGSADVRGALLRFAAGGSAEVLRDNPRRRLLRLAGAAAGGDLLVKHFRVGTGRHAWRERTKRLLGRSQAEREAKALAALHAAGAPVAEPLALAIGADGDAFLVLRYLPGVPLEAALAAPPRERRALLAALGVCVAALHRTGFVHGDLHQGNVWLHAGRPLLLDLQHARRTGDAAARTADLGQLDYSLWGRATLADRVRLRAAALGLARPFDAAAKRALRAVGRAAEERADAHARSRTRRALRPGRAQARVRIGSLTGLRRADLDVDLLAALLGEHEAAQRAGDARVLDADARSRLSAIAQSGRRVVVKETRFRGAARALADTVRGSAGRRAWRAGHGLAARGIGAALPLAFLEERRAGVPVRSLVVLEDLRPSPDALEASAAEPAAAALALADLAVRLHRRGVDHGDLKCTNVVLAGAPPYAAKLLDLEGVRFGRRVSDAARLEALAQINASLPDAVSNEARRRAWTRYRTALPFAAGRDAALTDVVARSLARRHRWSGAGCRLAERAGPSQAAGEGA